jgi:uncharacterized secreted protein with C-terminal beta-propeller domain
MRQRGLVTAVLAAALLCVPACSLAVAKSKRAAYPHAARLRSFSSCTGFLSYVHAYGGRTLGADSRIAPPGPVLATPVSAPSGTGKNGEVAPAAPTPATTAAPVAGQDFSGTNVQEAGIDEPDIVKTDGKRIFALENSKLYDVGIESAGPRVLGTLDLGDAGSGQQMLLEGDRLLVLSTTYAQDPPIYSPGSSGSSPGSPGVATSPPIATPAIAPLPFYFSRPQAVLTEVDVSDPAAPKVVKTLTVDGAYVDARQTGSTARVVIASRPRAFDIEPQTEQGTTTSARAAIRGAGVAKWLPSSTLANRRTGKSITKRLVQCNQVRRPASFSGLEMVTILTVDMTKGLPAVDTDTLLTDAETVYGSAGSLYIASQRWADPNVDQGEIPNGAITTINRFDASKPDVTEYRSSGAVSGLIPNAYSLSEANGKLRVASTDQPTWFEEDAQPDDPPQSYLTILGETGSSLSTVGRVGGLGAGQKLYAVRYVGDTAFVVTFRQIDPLYTVDLSDPTAPKVLGQLELEGYSSYLHPISDDLLMGVGEDATAEGRRAGTQLSLFDIRDLAHVRLIAHRAIGPTASSSAEYDPHAFLYWPPTKLAVVPINAYGQTQSDSFTGALGFHIGPVRGIQDAGKVTHPTPPGGYAGAPIDRSLVADGRLFTVSDAGVRASDLDDLHDLAFAAFPGAPSGGGGTVVPPGLPEPAVAGKP